MFMTAVQQDQQSWLDVFPLELFLKEGKGAVFVDVGGGVGHQCKALKERCPGITREVVLQDLGQAVGQAVVGEREGVRVLEGDFFEGVKVEG